MLRVPLMLVALLVRALASAVLTSRFPKQHMSSTHCVTSLRPACAAHTLRFLGRSCQATQWVRLRPPQHSLTPPPTPYACCLQIQSAAARHIMMLPVPPTTTLPIRALLQTGIKAVDNDTIAVLRAANVTKPAGLMTLNNMTGEPQRPSR